MNVNKREESFPTGGGGWDTRGREPALASPARLSRAQQRSVNWERTGRALGGRRIWEVLLQKAGGHESRVQRAAGPIGQRGPQQRHKAWRGRATRTWYVSLHSPSRRRGRSCTCPRSRRGVGDTRPLLRPETKSWSLLVLRADASSSGSPRPPGVLSRAPRRAAPPRVVAVTRRAASAKPGAPARTAAPAGGPTRWLPGVGAVRTAGVTV